MQTHLPYVGCELTTSVFTIKTTCLQDFFISYMYLSICIFIFLKQRNYGLIINTFANSGNIITWPWEVSYFPWGSCHHKWLVLIISVYKTFSSLTLNISTTNNLFNQVISNMIWKRKMFKLSMTSSDKNGYIIK